MARRFSAAERPRALALALAWFLVAVLAACGSPAPPGVDPFLQGVEPYGGPLPEGARLVSLDELKAFMQQGAVWDSIDRQERLLAAEDERAEADRATIQALAAVAPELNELLEPPDADADDLVLLPNGEYLLTIEDDEGEATEVTLLSHATMLREVVASSSTYQTTANLRALYEAAYDAAPAEVRQKLPTPESIGAGSVVAWTGALAELEVALAADLETRLQHQVRLYRAAHGLPADADGGLALATIDAFRPPGFTSNPLLEEGRGFLTDRMFVSPGLYEDTRWTISTQGCAFRDDGLHAWVWWPQKYYQTTAKRQGRRGSCVAFALTSAIESNVAIRQNRWVNLSEQRLYYEIKASWHPSNVRDGAPTHEMALALASSGFRVPYESAWAYNPSYDRKGGGMKATNPPRNSCDWRSNLDPSAYPHACSDTAHQGELVCHQTAASAFCAYLPQPNPGPPGYGLSGATVVWSAANAALDAHPMFDGSLPVHTIRAMLAAGRPMVMAVEVDSWFNLPFSGFVAPIPGAKKGGHAVHLVGFVPSDEIAYDITLPMSIRNRAPSSGGGFFIVKNSWGCGGDGGYWYLPVAWAAKRTKSITVFDRGPAPNYGLLPPTIDIVAPENNASFHVSPLLTVTFQADVSDPKDPTCCDVRWTSTVDGHLGHGTTLTVDFGGAESGARNIIATATNAAGLTATDIIQIVLTTSAPNVTITSPPKEPDPLIQTRLYAGLSYLFAAEEFSPLNAPQPCSAYTWTSTRAGEGPWSGCSPTINFDTTGVRLIILTVTNPQGQQGQDSIRIAADELPPDGPPVVTILSPASGREYFVGDEAILRFDALDPAGGKPTMSDVVWRIQEPGGPVKTITVQSRTIFDAPGRPGRPIHYFVPSDYVTPRCFPTLNPANAATLRLSYTNALGLTGFADVKLFVALPPDQCVN